VIVEGRNEVISDGFFFGFLSKNIAIRGGQVVMSRCVLSNGDGKLTLTP
jgi:hypothetical protein